MSSPDKLYSADELRGISAEDKEALHRELQHVISSDVVVRAILIAHKGVQGQPDDHPDLAVRALKHAGRGMREYLKEKLQPLYERVRSGRR
jgi:hypothetical protein